MKITNIWLPCLILFYLFGCGNNSNKLNEGPVALFLKDTIDLKTIKKGDIIDISFSLKNTGYGDLIIKNSSVGCGCTKIKPLKDTINPGETVDLNLSYDSKNDSGRVLKTVIIETNATPKLHVLYIKGLVDEVF